MATLQGLDANSEMTKHAVALRQKGIDFVIRYYSHNATKNLSKGEAHALSDAGLLIGAVWETAGVRASFFSRTQGLADGAAAFHMAREQIGQPAGTAIYFAVDYDAAPEHINGPISDYFRGVQAAFTAATNGGPGYQIGVYGSGLCCASLIEARLAELSWLSQSTGFAGSKEYADKHRYNLIQFLPSDITVDDGVVLDIDRDASNDALPHGLFTV